MIPRHAGPTVLQRLRTSPAVAILGARQVGKTTLSLQIEAEWEGEVHRLDLEDPRDLGRLADPGLALRSLNGLVIIDEVQRLPDLFPLLRVLVDRQPLPARFLLLGSASPTLVKGVSESLAGRVSFFHLEGFGLGEVGHDRLDDLWVRGGFPRSFLADDDASSAQWRRDLITTFVERDLPQLAIGLAGTTMRRFWTMLAHNHSQVFNQSALSRSFGVSDHTVRRYVDLLAGTYVVRVLAPWHENVSKRQVRRPKVYIADSGLLHTLLGLERRVDVERHPILGASWEGFGLSCVIQQLQARRNETFFWATHAGAELDLLVCRGNQRLGFEFKRTESPRRTRSMHSALETLSLDRLDVVHAGNATFSLGERIRAVALDRVLEDIEPI